MASVPSVVTKTICIEDKENRQSCSETTSVKSCSLNTNTSNKRGHRGDQPRLNRAHSCGSLFSLKERALLRQKLSSHVTAAFWDILSSTSNAVANSANENCHMTSAIQEVNKKTQQDLTLALKTNPLAVFQLQSTSRCCNLC